MGTIMRTGSAFPASRWAAWATGLPRYPRGRSEPWASPGVREPRECSGVGPGGPGEGRRDGWAAGGGRGRRRRRRQRQLRRDQARHLRAQGRREVRAAQRSHVSVRAVSGAASRAGGRRGGSGASFAGAPGWVRDLRLCPASPHPSDPDRAVSFLPAPGAENFSHKSRRLWACSAWRCRLPPTARPWQPVPQGAGVGQAGGRAKGSSLGPGTRAPREPLLPSPQGRLGWKWGGGDEGCGQAYELS
ncbi:hypothetical protein H8959_001718 [Pygathrix nigripes]